MDTSSKDSNVQKISIGETKIKLEPGLRSGPSKKVVIRMGHTVLAEKDFMSESDEEDNLVMDFPNAD